MAQYDRMTTQGALMRQLSRACDDGKTCPKIFEEDGNVIVQGALVEDRVVTDRTNPGTGEAVIRLPLALLVEAARRLEQR